MPPRARVDEMVTSVVRRWPGEVLPLLTRYARIPNLSPAFDPAWETTGHMEHAVELLAEWATARSIPGMTVEVVRLPGCTPTLLVDVPSTHPGATSSVLIYGHYDKQPPFDGWTEGRGPWIPLVEDDRLYARGVADDGYALPSALLAIEAVEMAGGTHGRCTILVEGSEESGSPHLPEVLDHLSGRIGAPDLVVALDSGCPTYDRLWITTSLRGAIVGTLTVSVLEHGVHSGSAGAVVPSSFRLARLLLDRIEDVSTGALLLPELRTDPPASAPAQAAALAVAVTGLGEGNTSFPIVSGLVLEGAGPAEQALRIAWSGSVAVVGADGLPPTETAGSVLRPFTRLKLAIRIPPNCDTVAAEAAIERALTTDPPNGATVTWSLGQAAGGWVAPELTPWIQTALDEASDRCFGNPSAKLGEGGTIPFLGWLAARFPDAHLLATGVLGPGSNAHGPDESLHLPTAARVTASMAILIDASAARPASA